MRNNAHGGSGDRRLHHPHQPSRGRRGAPHHCPTRANHPPPRETTKERRSGRERRMTDQSPLEDELSNVTEEARNNISWRVFCIPIPVLFSVEWLPRLTSSFEFSVGD